MALTDEDRKFIEATIRDETEPLKTQIENIWKMLKGGVNGDGIVTEFRLVQQALKSLHISVRSLVDRTDVNRNSLQSCQIANIPKVQQAIETSTKIEKKVVDFIEEVRQQRKDDREERKEEQKEYGSWIWFRDKRIDPIWIALALYIAVEAFKHFFVLP